MTTPIDLDALDAELMMRVLKDQPEKAKAALKAVSAELRRLRARNERLARALNKIEWVIPEDRCPDCGEREQDGHLDGCELKAALDGEKP